MFNTVRYNNITVSYSPHLDGGGMGFGQEYIRVVREKIGKVDHVFEYCSGPAFIGFSLMAHNLCERLTLADINPDAVKVCNETINNNNLQAKVSCYLSDCLDDIPETEQWDLVVGNPPHWPSYKDKYKEDITKYDPELRIHKKFYKDIRKFLKPNGSILLQENGRATSSDDFTQMIKENGLKVIDVFKAKPLSVFECILKRKKISRDTKPSPFYFIWIKPQEAI